jgi:hypothetical protein
MSDTSKEKNQLKDEQSKDENGINSKGLSNIADSDETSLSEAYKQNAFVLFLRRNIIKIKNHVAIVPLVMTVISLVVLFVSIHITAYAMSSKLTHDSYNAFFFFVNLVDSILLFLLYLNVYNRKASLRRKIIFSVLFFLALAGSLVIDFFYVYDIGVESSLFNSLNQFNDTKTNYVPQSLSYTWTHIILLFITLGTAVLAPVVQPFTKKIHLRQGKKNEETKG